MARYLIEVSHTERECVWSLQEMQQHIPESFELFEWGCCDGVHTGWATIDREHKFSAQELVPPALRAKARIVELCTFTEAELKAFHKREAS